MSLTRENYKEAVEILDARLGKSSKQSISIMDILLDVQAVHSIHDVVALKKFTRLKARCGV